MTVNDICCEIKKRLESVHIGCFDGMEKPLFLISEAYPGIWLEHVYDSVFYAMRDKEKLYLAENTVGLFIDNQKEDGQLPCLVLDPKRCNGWRETVGYSQIQECVSFARLCYEVYLLNGSREFLERVYFACSRWADWLKRNRMTTKRGLIEVFVGYDTGHDNSARLSGLSCEGNYAIDGKGQNASILPPDDEVAPMVAVDMSCNYYGTLCALAKMARELSLIDDAQRYESEAMAVKRALFEVCYDGEDAFFYDVDKMGNKRKYLSCTVFHLFIEGVLDPESDADIINEIYKRHISNPNEFATPYPYPSMAMNDLSIKGHADRNCWGYYTQGLTALRTTLWMERYGFISELENLKAKWLDAWTSCFDRLKLGQELDPITGEPTRCSEWYSSTMLFYLFAAGML